MQVTEITGGITPAHKTAYWRLKEQPIEKQRFYFFKDGILYDWVEDTRAESDTHVYWASSSCKPKWNDKTGLYIKKTSAYGCTYDKAKKTFKWWFGKQINHTGSTIAEDMCNYFKVEWFNSIPQGLKISTTNSNMNKVLLGKITNPRDLIKAIVKSNPVLRTKDISTELLWKYCKMFPGFRIQSISEQLSVAKNANHAIEYIMSKDHNIWEIQDLLVQALMLGRKIDFRWSDARMQEVHQEWTREIMDIEQDLIKNIDYQYVNELPHNGCLELITNSKDLYIEGRLMRHCVFTNYAGQVAAKSYFVLKYSYHGVRATLGINKNWNTDEFIINQMYAKDNKSIDESHHQLVKEWLAIPEVQEWFKNNYNSDNLVYLAPALELPY